MFITKYVILKEDTVLLIQSSVVLVKKHFLQRVFTFNITKQNMEVFHLNMSIKKNLFVMSVQKST